MITNVSTMARQPQGRIATNSVLTSKRGTNMRKLLTILGGAVALCLAVISIGANTTFGSLLTAGEERYIYAVLFGSLDVLKTLLPLIAAAAFVAGARTKGAVALATFAVLTLLSLTASIGLYATTKSEAVGDAKAARAKYADAVAARNKAQADLAALGAVRPAGDIAADLGELKRDFRYDRSKQCTDATATNSRQLCAQVDRLTGEAQKAAEFRRLGQVLAAAGVKVEQLDVGAAMKAIDPQAEQLAKLVSVVHPVTSENVRTALALLIAVLVEIGAGLGPWLVAPVSARHTKTDEKPASEAAAVACDLAAKPMPSTASLGDTCEDLVMRWASSALVRRRGAYLPAKEARASFEAWCASENAEPLNPTAFGKAMRAAGYKGCKIGGSMRYESVALTAARPAPLRVAVDNTMAAPTGRVLGRMVTVGRASAARS
jgi:hypothetical protein